MRKIIKICEKCKSKFDGYHHQKYCSYDCFLEDFTRTGTPRNLIIDDSKCKIWLGDVDDEGFPVASYGDKVVRVRDKQIDIPEGKRINVVCGNPKCMNKKHYELVDDLTKFGYL